MEQGDAEEQAHYASVLLSFREYEAFVMREIFRRKKHLQSLHVDMQRRLPQSSTMRNLHHFVVRVRMLVSCASHCHRSANGSLLLDRMQRTTTSSSWSASCRRNWSTSTWSSRK
jgi:hypothetical protein